MSTVCWTVGADGVGSGEVVEAAEVGEEPQDDICNCTNASNDLGARVIWDVL
jgi:hypothetical protein